VEVRGDVLKGGYWGPVRTRCRPSTRVHGLDFSFYQQGFGCCADGKPGREAVLPGNDATG
jgi:sulfatase modifying factor 1